VTITGEINHTMNSFCYSGPSYNEPLYGTNSISKIQEFLEYLNTRFLTCTCFCFLVNLSGDLYT